MPLPRLSAAKETVTSSVAISSIQAAWPWTSQPVSSASITAPALTAAMSGSDCPCRYFLAWGKRWHPVALERGQPWLSEIPRPLVAREA